MSGPKRTPTTTSTSTAGIGACVRACTLRRLGEKRLNIGKLRKVMKVNEGGDNRENDVTECMRVNKLIHLQEELDRETRTWLRPEIQAEIDKLKCD
jgi:hypothetical protein